MASLMLVLTVWIALGVGVVLLLNLTKRAFGPSRRSRPATDWSSTPGEPPEETKSTP